MTDILLQVFFIMVATFGSWTPSMETMESIFTTDHKLSLNGVAPIIAGLIGTKFLLLCLFCELLWILRNVIGAPSMAAV